MNDSMLGNVRSNLGAECQKTELARVYDRLNARLISANETAEAIRAFADRLLGERPETDANACAPRAVRSGVLGSISDLLEQIEERQSHIDVSLRRLSEVA